MSGLGVLNECGEPRSSGYGSRLKRERNLLYRRAVEIDRADLFADPRDGDVRQQSAGIFSMRNLGFTPVVGERNIPNSAHAFEVLVRGAFAAPSNLISVAH